MNDAREIAICSLTGITHISEKISRCCKQVRKVKYSPNIVHQVTLSINKPNKNNFKNMKKCPLKLSHFAPLVLVHIRCYDCNKYPQSVFAQKTNIMSRVMRKPTFWFPTLSHTNQAVQLQKMARGLKFRI